jgi:hypothetical protein
MTEASISASCCDAALIPVLFMNNVWVSDILTNPVRPVTADPSGKRGDPSEIRAAQGFPAGRRRCLRHVFHKYCG